LPDYFGQAGLVDCEWGHEDFPKHESEKEYIERLKL